MKIIVAGTRSITDYAVVERAIRMAELERGWSVDEIVSGNARGVDSQAESYAQRNQIRLRTFPADWDSHSDAAGPIRNRSMAEFADALVAVWGGESKGTLNMIETAKQKNLQVYRHVVE